MALLSGHEIIRNTMLCMPISIIVGILNEISTAVAGGHFYLRLYGRTLRLLWAMLESGECLKWLRSLWTWFLRNSCFVSWRWHVSQWWPPLQASSQFFLLSFCILSTVQGYTGNEKCFLLPWFARFCIVLTQTAGTRSESMLSSLFFFACIFCGCQPLQKL